MCLTNKSSVSWYQHTYVRIASNIKFYQSICRLTVLLHSTVLSNHINVRLEVSHNQNLYKVIGYKYILYILHK